MDYLQSLLEHYNNTPFLVAFILGLMTAISPCPLATNITATAYISKNITNKKKVFISGVLYALGRGFSYSVLGLLLFFGASKFHIALFFNQNGERFLGPLLVIIGLIMLNIIKLNFLNKFNLTDKISEKLRNKGLLGSFLLGVVFALAFCPYSGVLFFGMLIPITISSPDGLFLPILFAFGTGLPVILFTYLLAFTTEKVGAFYMKLTRIEKIMRIIAGLIFLVTGIYYLLLFSGII